MKPCRNNIAMFASLLLIILAISDTGSLASLPEETSTTQAPVELDRTCNAEISTSALKTGTCPPPDMYLACFWCNDNCKSDNECPDTKKCCPQPGCGNWCKDPQ